MSFLKNGFALALCLMTENIFIEYINCKANATPPSSSSYHKRPLPFLPPPVIQAQWEQLGGTSSHVSLNILFSEILTPLWTASFGVAGEFLSSPIVAEGRLYSLDNKGYIHVLDAITGQPLWKISSNPLGQEGESVLGGGLAYKTKKLFAATSFGELKCLNPETGDVIWTKSLPNPARTPPTLDSSRGYIVTFCNELCAFDQDTGQVLWVHKGIQGPIGQVGGSIPAVSQGIVVVAYPDGEVFGLQDINGKILWSYTSDIPLTTITQAYPIISGDMVIVHHNGQLTALNLYNGKCLWTKKMSSISSPLVVEDLIFQIKEWNHVVCLNKEDGSEYWSEILPKTSENESTEERWNGPCLIQNQLYFINSKGTILSFDPVKRKTVQLYSLSGPSRLIPVVVKDKAYFLTEDGQIQAFQ